MELEFFLADQDVQKYWEIEVLPMIDNRFLVYYPGWYRDWEILDLASENLTVKLLNPPYEIIPIIKTSRHHDITFRTFDFELNPRPDKNECSNRRSFF